jgi:hypothetical protein
MSLCANKVMNRYRWVICTIIGGVVVFSVGYLLLQASQSYKATAAVDELRGRCQTNLDWVWDKLDVGRGRPRFGRIVEIDFMNTSGDRPYLQNDDLNFLREVSSLETLNLALCVDITDDALVHLRGLRNLRELDLRDTQVTSTGVNELKRILPHCKILHNPVEN